MIKPQTLFCTWGQYDSVKSNDLPKTPQITHGRQGEDPTLWTSRSKDFLFPLAAWRSYVCSRQPRSLQRLPTSGCFCGWGSSHSESGLNGSEGSSDSLFSVTVSFLPSGPRDGWGGNNTRLSGHHVSAGCLRRHCSRGDANSILSVSACLKLEA